MKVFKFKQLHTELNGLKFRPSIENEHPMQGRITGEGDDADWIEYGFINNELTSMQFIHEAVDQGKRTEFTDENKQAIKIILDDLKSKKEKINILEIGVGRSKEHSSTEFIVKNKRKDDFYFGVDLNNDQLIPYNNSELNQYTICCNSNETDKILQFCELNGVKYFDFIFIDGWHSINQVLEEWKFTNNLLKGGYVGLHDTNYHPGPYCVFEAIDEEKYEKTKYCTNTKIDPGIAFAKKI
jgi:hypothetical protein